MSITIGNPIVITSGTANTEIRGNYKVNRVIWKQPDLVTSSFVITKKTSGGPELLNLGVEVSGQSQTADFDTVWWNDPFVKYMPTGTAYIYTK